MYLPSKIEKGNQGIGSKLMIVVRVINLFMNLHLKFKLLVEMVLEHDIRAFLTETHLEFKS